MILRSGNDVYITRPVMYQGRELIGSHAIGIVTAVAGSQVRVKFDPADNLSIYYTFDVSEVVIVPADATNTKE